jgi:dihydropteroate synthase
MNWRCGKHQFEIGSRALVMGIVNVTPDSFSDGGRYFSRDDAVEHALQLVAEGADILDVGGESSRPGAQPITLDEERERVVPVVVELTRRTSIPLSIDTTKAEIARECLQAGAVIINDITGLRGDPAMPEAVRSFGAGSVVMHMQGTPATMQENPAYGDVVGEVCQFFQGRLNELTSFGIDPATIAFDPGIGFGKTMQHNLLLLKGLAVFQRLGRPVCLGVSRKGVIGQIIDRPRSERMVGSVAVAAFALAQGAAQILRVHDVGATRDAVRMWAAIAETATGWA